MSSSALGVKHVVVVLCGKEATYFVLVIGSFNDSVRQGGDLSNLSSLCVTGIQTGCALHVPGIFILHGKEPPCATWSIHCDGIVARTNRNFVLCSHIVPLSLHWDIPKLTCIL